MECAKAEIDRGSVFLFQYRPAHSSTEQSPSREPGKRVSPDLRKSLDSPVLIDRRAVPQVSEGVIRIDLAVALAVCVL